MILPGSNLWPQLYPGKLLCLSALRYSRQHLWQSCLSFVGIMLGVMMVVAIDLANSSASKAFALSVASVNGTLSHQIVGGSEGVPEAIFTRLRTELGIRRSAPGLSGQININEQAFTLIGVDAISEVSLARQRPGLAAQNTGIGGAFLSALVSKDGVLLTETTALKLGLLPQQTFEITTANDRGISTETFSVLLAATLESSEVVSTEGLVFADISLAQILLRSQGRVDSIDLVLTEVDAQRIRQWLPDGLTLVDAQTRNDSLLQMTSAFHVNLLAMSMLSLLVAGLLIYNTVTLSILQKEKTLGIFRSQGVSRKQIFTLVLGESALMGLIASTAGLLLGYKLGQVLVVLVSRGIPDLSFRLNVTSFLLDPWSLAKGLLLGLGITLLSAALPAWRATHCAPITLQQRAVKDGHWRKQVGWIALLGLSMMALGYLLLLSEINTLVAGFVALTFIVFGFCFLVPGVMLIALKLVTKYCAAYFSISSRMALRNTYSGISRSGLAVAALTVAISVTVGVGVMVGSFRDTVILWLGQSFAGDIVVTGEGLSPQLRFQLEQIVGVDAVNATTLTTVEAEFGQVRVSTGDLPAELSFYLKESSNEQISTFNDGQGILISEPLAYLQQLGINDSIQLNTDKGMASFPIVGIFYDYTPGLGMLGFPKVLYDQWWDGSAPSRFSIYVDENMLTKEETLLAVREVLNEQGQPIFAISNSLIRQQVLAIFDRTFAITNVLRLLALLVAFIGVLSALMALLLERLREFALLRASGMTPGQIVTLILTQTSLMGLFAGLLSLPLGLIMSEVLIDVINQRSFGWSMQHSLPVSVLVQAFLLAITAAFIAGIYPAMRAARVSPGEALREE